MSINVIVIEGRLVKDSIVGQTANGFPVTKMRIAHNKWNKKEQKEEPKFFSVKIYKDIPLEKGSLVLIKGELDYYEYTDDTGSKQSFTSIQAYEIIPFIIKKKDPIPSNTDKVQGVFAPDDDIPF